MNTLSLCVAALGVLSAPHLLHAQVVPSNAPIPHAAVPAATNGDALTFPAPPKLEVPGLKGETVPLTLRQVVLTTLAQNLNMQISLKNRDAAAEQAWGTYGIYDPTLGAALRHEKVERPIARGEDGSAYKGAVSEHINEGEVSIAQLTPLGSTVTLFASQTDIDDQRLSQQGEVASLFDPSVESSASIQVRQPLLKNFGPLVTNARIRIAKRELEQSNEQFRDEVINRLADVMTAYWNLDFSLRNLEVQRQAMESARELERVNSKRVEVGDLPHLSLLQAQAQVAERESLMVEAESLVIDAQDLLLQLMNWSRNDARWNQPIYPSDQLSYYPELDVNDTKAIQVALDRRPDIKQDRLELQIAEITRDVTRRQRLPELDAIAGYTYSGLDDNSADSAGDVTAGYYGGYNLGLEFRFPLLNRAARADYRTALDNVDSAGLTISNRELQVTREVRAATRSIRTALKQIQATTRQTTADTEKLAAERKRMDVGERTIFDVLDFEDDLALSRANQARALADYQIALIDLARSTGTLLDAQGVTVEDQEPPRGWSTGFEPSKERPTGTAQAREWVDFLRSLGLADAPKP